MEFYKGKNIYLGIDVHKKTYSITAICEKAVIKKDTMFACPMDLVKYCKKNFKGATIWSVYEAGFCGFSLHRKLIANDINNIVVNPASIETAARERTKTDKRDSKKMAEQLAAGRLHGIFVPSEKQERKRLVSRQYEATVDLRRRVGNRLKSFLNYFGFIHYDDTKKISKKFLIALLKVDYGFEINFVFKKLAETWAFLNKQRLEIKKVLALQAEEEAEIQAMYESFPGVGLISGRILANELENMLQFPNEKSLYSFLGLTPQEYSSGGNQRFGHISHQGRPVLRKILVQIAWKAIKYDKELKEVFEEIAKRAGNKRAIIAVARRIAGQMRACFKKGLNSKVKTGVELIPA